MGVTKGDFQVAYILFGVPAWRLIINVRSKCTVSRWVSPRHDAVDPMLLRTIEEPDK